MRKGNEAVGDKRSYPYLRSNISISDLYKKVKNNPNVNYHYDSNE